MPTENQAINVFQPGEELNSGRLRQLADSLFQREEFKTGVANNIPDDLHLESVFEVLKSVANKEEVLSPVVEPVDDALAFDLSLFTGGLPQQKFNFAPDKKGDTDQALSNGSKAGFVPSTFSNYAFGRDQQIRYTDNDYLDVNSIRNDFPILHQKVNGKDLIWFDNAATTQKPRQVIDGIARFYEQDNSNIHRAAHTLAARSTDAYEKAREKVKSFIGASSTEEIIFVRGTTEGINLVTQTYGWKFIQPGDEIIVSTLDHHANIVPWQQLAKEKGAKLVPIPINNNGDVLLEDYEKLLGPRTKFVSIGQVNNTFGTISPVKQMIESAHRWGARVLIDGAQSVAHTPINVQELDADFFVFSGHKIYAPNGIGVVFGKKELLDIIPPWQGGGNMIQDVTFEETVFNAPPAKFEAGTPNVADAVGLGFALDYVSRIGINNISKYEHYLTEYAREELGKIDGLRLIGNPKKRVSVVSFVLDGIPTPEVGRLLDQEGIALRAGHHCAQPALRRLGVEATVRPSFAFYNTTEEIDKLVVAIRKVLYSR
ncbi:MAG: cysteine desulfurase [Bacteroidota bacterium]|nr:cysteine desulfurase [Bacteroidota bacterium]MDP4269255.1 cysteine desulfurase [Bacteroidota bacterium]